MATRTVKARVELDGEKQYKQAIQELNKGNSVLSSEMRKLQAEYKGQSESTEFLTKKGELLERQLLQQRDKVETLREAMAAAAQQYGEADARTQDWAIKLNNAEAAQYDLEHAIEENNQALQGEEKTLYGLGDTLSDLTRKLGIKLPDSAKKALNGMQGLSAGTVAAMGASVAAVTALIKAAQRLHEMTLEAAADVDEILTDSMTTGLSERTIQSLKYAENLIDVSYGSITSTLTKLTRNMAEAADGNASLADAFAGLGVSILDTEGGLRSAESVLYDVIDALGEIDNGTQRDAVAMDLLGKSAQEMNPLILQGSAALKDLAAEAEATGYVLDESQLQKLGEVDDAYQRLQLQIEATKKELAVEFAPASQAAMETFARVVSDGGKALANSGLIKGFAEILVSLTGMMEPLEALLGITPGLTSELQPLYTVLHAIAGVFAWIADVGNAAIGFLTGWSASGRQRLNTALGLNTEYGMYSNLQRWQGMGSTNVSGNYYDPNTGLYSGNYYAGRNASGNDNWRGGLTYLSEAGAELAILPSGTRILNAQDTRQAVGGTQIFYVTIDAKNVREFNDIVELAQSARVRDRMR